MNYLFVIWGISDSGKDTISQLIDKSIGAVNVKFAAPFKRAFEKWLLIHDGTLDNKEFRIKPVRNPVTGEDETFDYNELMLKAYDKWSEMYDYLTCGYVMHDIAMKGVYQNVCLTDVRKKTEVEAIKRIADRFNTILIQVEGRGVQKRSDMELSVDDFSFIRNGEYRFSRYVLNNHENVSMEMLEHRVRYILKDCGAL